MPGEDPKIIIRAQTSWNNSDPLVLVDGVERPMNTVDIASVESISVLRMRLPQPYMVSKVRMVSSLSPPNVVTKVKASVHVKANATMKVVSKLPEKFDSTTLSCC